MISFLNYLAISLFAIAMYGPIQSRAAWPLFGPVDFSASGPAHWQRLKIATDNTLYMSFSDDYAGGGCVMRYDGTNWNLVGNAGFTQGRAFHSNMCLGLGDTIYFSYADSLNSLRAAVMRYDGNAWTSLGTNISSGQCNYSDIEVGPDGTPYLIYKEATGGAIVAKMFDGSNWITMGSGPISNGGSDYPVAGTDHSGNVYVAFTDGSNSNYVTLVKWDGNNWIQQGPSYLAGTTGSANEKSIAFDSNDNVWIAYRNNGGSIIKFDGTSWSTIGSAVQWGYRISLALTPNDTPYVAYVEGINGYCVAARFDGSSWASVSNNVMGDMVDYVNMAIDGNGNPFVAYQRFYDKTCVNSYTYCTAPAAVIASANDSSICSGDAVTLSVSGNLNDATDWYWYSGSCGGILEGTGTSLTLTPADTTTYYVMGLGGCVLSGACTPMTIDVGAPVPTITVSGSTLTSSASTGNQWYTNGAPINGETAQTYTATVSGWYYTIVSDGNCTSQSDSVLITISVNSVGLAPSEKLLNVYPVPFSEVLNIDLASSDTKLSLSICDNTGRVLDKRDNLKEKNTINLNKLSPGFYFLNLSDGKERHIYKVSKH